jgi:mono/diheme cytochrome c family protein
MTRRWALAVAATLVSALLASCGRMPGRPGPGSVEIRPDKVKNFDLLYSENCSACHGPGGRGAGAAIGLANPVYLAIADDAVLTRATAQGVPGSLMPAFALSFGGELTDEQVAILVAGIRAWARPDALGGGAPPAYSAPAGDPARGAGVYDAACASCHGAGGTGGPKGGSLVDGSFLGLVSDQGLRTTVIAGRPDIGHPDWRGDAAGRPLSGEQVSDVVAWLASMRPATPGAPYGAKSAPSGATPGAPYGAKSGGRTR